MPFGLKNLALKQLLPRVSQTSAQIIRQRIKTVCKTRHAFKIFYWVETVYFQIEVEESAYRLDKITT